MHIPQASSRQTLLDRRLLAALLSLVLAAYGGTEQERVDNDTLGTQQAAARPLRLMAANITSGNLQSYDPGEGSRIFKGTKPDVVMIQEFNYDDNSRRPSELRRHHVWHRLLYYREGGAQIPTASSAATRSSPRASGTTPR